MHRLSGLKLWSLCAIFYILFSWSVHILFSWCLQGFMAIARWQLSQQNKRQWQLVENEIQTLGDVLNISGL